MGVGQELGYQEYIYLNPSLKMDTNVLYVEKCRFMNTILSSTSQECTWASMAVFNVSYLVSFLFYDFSLCVFVLWLFRPASVLPAKSH